MTSRRGGARGAAEQEVIQSLHDELRDTRRELDHLYRDFNSFQNHVTSQLNNAQNPEAAHFLQATKIYLRRALLQEFHRPPKRPSVLTDSDFTSVLR